MTGNAARLVRFAAGFVGLATLGWVLTGQAARPAGQGFPNDWSHQHVIFSRPATAAQAAAIASDPRYWQQWYRQNVSRTLADDRVPWDSHSPGMRGGEPHGDWSQNLGSGGSVGAGNFPAKYSFGITTASCTNDYVVFSTGLAGATNQASVVAYSNLYSGCGGTVPSTYWAYNTGATILTSPAISEDGTQIAFVQTSAVGGPAELVLLKWAASTSETVSSPKTLTAVSNSAYRSCSAPCMTEVFLVAGGGVEPDDRTSSVFPDYSNDVIWVGGELGWLYKFTGVFRGTPAEVTTGGFPVQVNNTTFVSSPVYDHASGNVFVGDANGFLYRVTNASPPVVTASAQIDHGVGIVAGPILDSTAELVYAFSSNDGSTGCPGGVPCSAVYQFSTNFVSGNSGSEVTVGSSSGSPNPLYAGAFDNTYESSSNATGNLYVCGNTGVNPTLYRVPITAGTFGKAASVAALTTAANQPICSPVTDIANPNATGGPAEAAFFSVQNNGRPGGCAGGGCGQRFVTTPWQASTSYQVGQEILVLRTAGNSLWINVVSATTGTGMSGTTMPAWPNTIGTTTVDNGVTWLNQGGTTVAPLAVWTKNHAYLAATRIVDSNGNVEIVSIAGTSGTSAPAWSTKAGSNTSDNGVTWINAGKLPVNAIATAGGASGTIMDNVVGSGTLVGASQVYASTISNQTCGTSGTGGCAIQASQAALQ